jgi:hypothetical protein
MQAIRMKRNEQALQAKYSAILREQESDNGQPVAAFCKKRGISPASFYRWKNILRSSTKRDSCRERFLPVTMTPPLPADNAGHRYDFRFSNGAALQISGSLDTADLSELIRVIRELFSMTLFYCFFSGK